MNLSKSVSAAAMAITSVLFLGEALPAATVNTKPKQLSIEPERLGAVRPIFARLIKEKIRFGYGSADMYPSPDEPALPSPLPATIEAGKYRFDILRKLSDSGFNGVCLLFGGWEGGPAATPAEFETYLRFWADACKRYNLYLVADIQYGQFYKTYRRFYDGAGKEAKAAVCPRNQDYWREEMLKRSLIIAKVSREYPNILLGENYDFEMYISDFANYPGPCMCDVCFGDFAREFLPNTDAKKLPAAGRRDWLKANDLAALYARFMEREMGSVTAGVEKVVHQVNPDFVLSYFPAFEWIPGVTRGLGTPSQPVIVFSEREYTPGFSPIIEERVQRLDREGYPALYCPGLWNLQHNPRDIPSHLYQMAQSSAGYWIYNVHAFWQVKDPDSVFYKGSTAQDYLDAFRIANTAIVERLKKGPSYRPPFTLPGRTDIERPRAEIFHTTEPPQLDGKLNDLCWAKAARLILRNNSTGEVFAPHTTGLIAYDDDYLYLAVQCDEPEMDKLQARNYEYGDFDVFSGDRVEIFLDTEHKMSSCFHIGVNPLGMVAEHRLDGSQEDRSWRSGVLTAGTRRQDGWDLEMAFPLERLAPGVVVTGSVWGVNIARGRAIPGVTGRTRLAAWSPTFGLFNEPTRFGEIIFAR